VGGVNEFYSIGDVARRAGLSVSAVRYYADIGVVVPNIITPAGHRLYDVSAIARLELVRTLRELDAGLEDVRRVLGGEATLSELAATHLALLEQQEARLRSRRAVLSAIVRQGSTAEQVTLMHRLVGMSDEERDRLIDEFWTEVSTGWEPPERMLEWWRSAQPIGQAVMDAAREGVAPDSPLAREIADRWIGWLTGIFATPDSPGMPDTPEFRIQAADHMLAGAEWDRTPPDPESPYDRYMELVIAVNGTPPEQYPFEWLAAALRASVPDHPLKLNPT
jgi:DNA-binding transcriptional MerR regulator